MRQAKNKKYIIFLNTYLTKRLITIPHNSITNNDASLKNPKGFPLFEPWKHVESDFVFLILKISTCPFSFMSWRAFLKNFVYGDPSFIAGAKLYNGAGLVHTGKS